MKTINETVDLDQQAVVTPTFVKTPQAILNTLYRSNLITVDYLGKDILHRLFNLAHDLRLLTLSDKDLTSMLKGKLISQMFFEPSTRTQCSFAAAAQRLGASVIFMDQQVI